MTTEIWFRNADPRFPFFRDDVEQAAARWHASGAGPVQYLADTSDGAWAEFLRHEGIVDADDLIGVERSLWAIEVDLGDETIGHPELPQATLRGDLSTYEACQIEADRLREEGASSLVATAAGLREDTAGGELCSAGALHDHSNARDGRTLVLFGLRPDYPGWCCCDRGRPQARVVGLVRPL